MCRVRYHHLLLVVGVAFAGCSAAEDDLAGSTETTTVAPDASSGSDDDATTLTTGTAGETNNSATSGSEDDTSGSGDVPAEPPASLEEAIALYGAAWNERDDDARLALLSRVWDENGLYQDPSVTAHGPAELSEAIGAFHDDFADAELVLNPEVNGYDQVFAFSWAIEGSTPLLGFDYGEFGEDFRITQIAGFFGPLVEVSEVPEAVETYVAAWNETDPALRMALLEDAVAQEVIYRDPSVQTVGLEALNDQIGVYQAQFAGAQLVLTAGPDGNGDMLRFAWAVQTADGTDLVTGFDVVERDEAGTLRRIVGFFGPPPA